MNITEDTIKKLSRLFYQKLDADQAGQYRSIQVYISGTEYIPPSPEEVPQLMKHLADQIHSPHSMLHPIELAVMAHKRLVDIHLFVDGNCKTARPLINLILVNAGYGVVSGRPDRHVLIIRQGMARLIVAVTLSPSAVSSVLTSLYLYPSARLRRAFST